MKKWTNPRYTTIAIYTFLVLLAALAFLLLVFRFPEVVSTLEYWLFTARGVVMGVVIALALFPLAERIERLFKGHIFRRRERPRATRFFSVLVTFLILVICIGIVVVSILPMMYQNYQELAANLTGYADSLVKLIQSNEMIYNFILSQAGLTGNTPQEIIQNLVERYSALFSSFAGGLLNFISSLTMIVSDTLIALILAFYFLLSRDTVGAIFRKLSVAFLPRGARHHIARFCTRLYTDFMNFISARLTSSFALGVLCYLLTWALGVKFYPIISLFALVLNIVPVVGPFLAICVCTLIVGLAQPQAALIFLAIIITLNMLEHFFIERHLLSRRLRPNIAMTLVVVIVGYHYFGLGGTIFAIPVFVTLRTEFSILLEHLLGKKGLPTDIGSYLAPLPPEPTVPAEEQDTPERDEGDDGEYASQNAEAPAEPSNS